jgi:predicted porin
MKNLFLFLILMFSAQVVFAQKFSFGLKGGANATDFYYSNTPKSLSGGESINNTHKPEISYEFGATVRQKLNQRWALNGEVLYTQRKTITNYSNGNYTIKGEYLAIPVFVSYNFYKPLSLDLGAEYSRLIKTNIVYKDQFYDNFNYLSGIIGLKYAFSKNLNAHFRYIHALNKVSAIEWTDFNGVPIGTAKLYSRTFSLAIGYNF